MKQAFLFFTILICIGCSGGEPANAPDANRERIIAKNQETAARNEASLVTQAAQKLEKDGRALETYRRAGNAASRRECDLLAADQQKQVQTLADRIAKLPESNQTLLAPIIGDLNECVSCAKTAMESCVKARASINKAIKQMFP